MPASRGAPSRARRRGRQCCSRASHTGRQVLRGRLHDDFFDLVLDEPVGQRAQVGRRGADLLALEVEVAVDLDVGHHDRQHLLVDVNSRDPVRHRPLLGGAESVPRRISQGRELSPELSEPHDDAQLFTQSRTLRTKQLLGLNSSTGWFDLAAPDRIVARADFHRLSRAAGPRQPVAEIVQCGEPSFQLVTESASVNKIPLLSIRF